MNTMIFKTNAKCEGCLAKIEEILQGKISREEWNLDCISGFHLYDPLKKRTENINLIKDIANTFLYRNTTFYTCHCTGKEAYGILKGIADEKINYISTGQIIQL